MRYPAFLLAPLVLALAACAASGPQGAPTEKAMGCQKSHPIEVCRPAGERAYLSALVCPASGQAPLFQRIGSVGQRTALPGNLTKEQESALLANVMRGLDAPSKPGEPDYHVIDAYELQCGEQKVILYLDMYHCGQPLPQQPPHGFTRE
jgi:hypothetical protein